jgi:glycosyltransferase involved in cell wall biosynthesis
VKIIVFKARWGHMGEKSGFPLWEILKLAAPHGAVQELEVPKSVPTRSLWFRIARKLGVIAEKVPSVLPSSPWVSVRQEMAAAEALSILAGDPSAFLVLPMGEDELCVSLVQAPPEIKRRIFVCFHQPPAWYRLHWLRYEDWDGLGGIVCLSREQAEFFRETTGTSVVKMRHGVNHDFFRPPEDFSIRKGDRLLFVGQWLRDFEVLCESMRLVWSALPDITLDCVVPRSARSNPYIEKLAADRRVRWHAQISDEELRNLYQNSDLLFMPLRESTANNGLLEAMACALPVITTRIGGVPEYFQEGAGELCTPGDVAGHAAAVLKWIANPALRHTAQNTARSHILQNHDWKCCVKFLMEQFQ